MRSSWHRLIAAAAPALLLATLSAARVQSPPALRASDWTLGGGSTSAYVMEATGRATDPNGADVSLRSANDTAGVFGSATSRLGADPLRQRRLTISGELQTRGAGGASLWLRVDRGTTVLMLDNGADQVIRGDADWTRRSVSLPVPADATEVVFGVLLQGAGSVSVRTLRVDAGAPLSPKDPVAKAAKDVLDAAIDIVQKHALRRKDVAWRQVEPRVRALAAGSAKTSEVYPAIRYLLAQLGDHHSFLMPPAQTTAFKTGGAQNPIPEVRSLPGGTGYISVPGYSGSEPGAMRAYAAKVHESLNSTLPSSSCGWVVDLRSNTGGNMWPMLAGLKPFLGSAGLGTFESPTGSSPKWVAGQSVGVEPPPALGVLENAWVAVLTGPRTASSGEAVTIAFRGRPHTRSFGLPTAGLSTANGTFPLPDGAMILLTTAVEADRTGRKYGDKIDPDERVEAGTTAAGDAALAAATQWLGQRCVH